MKVGFIGLGNVGGKLAGSLLRNGFNLIVGDLDKKTAQALLDNGADWADSPKQMAQRVDIIITCLPSPAACSLVMEGHNGVIEGLKKGSIWLEMSTTDEAQVKRIAEKVHAKGATAMDTPVSGGCHRAETGNIAIFAGGDRAVFEQVLPLLTTMGRQVLHTGELGSASILKVVTNYLASANLLALCEALVISKLAKMDLNTTYEAIRISSGNSFVHETESQVILNGSRNINFTMDLVVKDLKLFCSLADRADMKLDLASLILDIFKNGETDYGAREWSSNIIKRLEETAKVMILADGFPSEMRDTEPEQPGYEVKAKLNRKTNS